MKKGYKHTEETKEKIKLSKIGKKRKPLSIEWKNKISNSLIGRIGSRTGIRLSIDTKEKIRQSMIGKNIGKIISEKQRKQISIKNKGRKNPHSYEHRKKLSESHKGEKSNFWKGGISNINDKIRKSIEFRLWREAVFARDNWTCQKTGIKGGNLHPHHIQNFSQYPELRFAIDNGITLSEKSHREFHRKYGYRNNTKSQLEEFISEVLP